MTRTLVVRGGRPLVGTTRLPGDKSISHRALLIGSLAEGATRVRNLSSCADVRRTLDCVRALGVRIDDPLRQLSSGGEAGRSSPGGSDTLGSEQASPDGARRVIVHGCGTGGLDGPPVELCCGDSGTTMRLLAGVLAGQRREFVLDGSRGLRRRPMRRVVAPLKALGAQIEDTDGLPPLNGRGGSLVGADVLLDRPSAQVGSAVLLAALNASGRTLVTYPGPVRDHTERMLVLYGVAIAGDEANSRLTGPVARLTPPAGDLVIPGDASAAANLVTAATLVAGSRLSILGMGVNPGRTGFLDIVRRMGAHLAIEEQVTRSREPSATVSVRPASLRSVEIGGSDVPRAIDELPLVAVLGSQAEGTTVVRDAAELRLKESDRIASVAQGLRLMGAHVEERPHGFAVQGPVRLAGAEVDGCDDHRIVMALAVAGLAADGETRISGAECVSDSFPGFASTLARLGADVRME